jgi:peroxiredoxin
MNYVSTLRTWAVGLLMLASAGAFAASGQDRAIAAGRDIIGQPAPRMVLKTIDGKDLDLGALYGKKAVYLKFWATWCVPCREQMPHFEHTFEQAGPGLAVIGVNAGFNETLDDIQRYKREHQLGMPLTVDDGRLAKALHLRVTPQHIVIGRDGRILYVGHLAGAKLEAALQQAQALAPVTAGTPMVEATALTQVKLGDQAPALKLKTLDKAAFSLADQDAKRSTVLVFLSPWCESYLQSSRPRAAAECRSVRQQVAQLLGNKQVRWLGIASGLWASEQELDAYRKHYAVKMPLTLDESGDVFRSFGVQKVPTLVVLDAQGKVVRRVDNFDQKLPVQLAQSM